MAVKQLPLMAVKQLPLMAVKQLPQTGPTNCLGTSARYTALVISADLVHILSSMFHPGATIAKPTRSHTVTSAPSGRLSNNIWLREIGPPRLRSQTLRGPIVPIIVHTDNAIHVGSLTLFTMHTMPAKLRLVTLVYPFHVGQRVAPRIPTISDGGCDAPMASPGNA
jgi:hypothetical protein